MKEKNNKIMKKFFTWLEGQDNLREVAEGLMSSPKMLVLLAAVLALLATIFK